MTQYFIDTEFVDDGKTIELISIGIVASDGRELYLQSCEFDPYKATAWIKENVWPHLTLCPHIGVKAFHKPTEDILAHKDQRGQCTYETPARAVTGLRGVRMSGGYLVHPHPDCPWRTRAQIREEVRNFINASDGKPELIGWCAGYDFVALCQLFGTMMDTPTSWPHHMCDLQCLLDERGITDDMLPKQEDTHHALADARYIRQIWQMLKGDPA